MRDVFEGCTWYVLEVNRRVVVGESQMLRGGVVECSCVGHQSEIKGLGGSEANPTPCPVLTQPPTTLKT